MEVTHHEVPNGTRIRHLVHDGHTLRVFFASGSIFDYEDVSDALVTNLAKALEPERFLVHHIRPDRVAVPVIDGQPFTRGTV